MSRRARMIQRRRQVQRNRRIALFVCLLLCSIIIVMTAGHTRVTAHQDTFKYYTDVTVKEHDTLWTIAESYYSKEFKDMHSYIDEVCEINHIGRDIYPGQIIIVPYYSGEVK